MLKSLKISCFRPFVCVNPRFRGDRNSPKVVINRALYPTDYKENYYIEVPCGKCFLCRKKKANMWRVRLYEEMKDVPTFIEDGIFKYRTAFVTFTFDDDNVPHTDRRDCIAVYIRKWRDLWRKKYGKSPRYFCTTDKGSQFGRIHLHLLIFNPYNYVTNRPLEECDLALNNFMWRFGLAGYKDGALWLESMRGISYVTSYVTGGNLQKDATKHGKPICKEALQYVPLVFVSNRLGKGFFERCGNRYSSALIPTYEIGGFQYALPTYYRNKLIPYFFRWHSNVVYKYERSAYLSSDNVRFSFMGRVCTYEDVKFSYNERFKQFDEFPKFTIKDYAKKSTYKACRFEDRRHSWCLV